MQLSTYTSIKTKLQNDLDVQDFDFVQESELLGYINEAIDDCESIIHTLGLDTDYFLTQGNIALVSGTADYSLPSDIFASKIKKIFYVNGTQKYEVFRVRNLVETINFQSGDDYKYRLVATTGTANNMRIRFYPTPNETSSTNIVIWYIRNVTALTTSTAATNVCEVPEAVNFIYQHCKARVYEKMGNPNLAVAIPELAAQKSLMIETLQEMVPDENTIIEPDMSFYEDAYLGSRNQY